MISAILNALGGIGSAIGSFFDYFKYKKMADAIEDKNDAENKAKDLERTLSVIKKTHQRAEQVEKVNDAVKNVPKKKRTRKTKVIKG